MLGKGKGHREVQEVIRVVSQGGGLVKWANEGVVVSQDEY